MTSRVRLKTIEEAPEETREFMLRRGDLNVFRLLANAPQVFGGWTRMTDELLSSSTFSFRMRELVILRVAELQQCPYMLAQHRDVAGDLESGSFDDTELTVLRLVTELCTTKHVGVEAFAAAHAVLGTEAVTELLMIVSLYYGLALVLNAVDLDIDDSARLKV